MAELPENPHLIEMCIRDRGYRIKQKRGIKAV